MFSLARKLQPAIVFIDEIDAVLGTRRSGEHEASGMVKAEFMTLWDGLTSSSPDGSPQRILVLGATNRIGDIDEAILRRMPKKFAVGLPGPEQRLRIFSLLLKDTKVDKEDFDLELLVRASDGMSGSDIKEACRDAAMSPVREYVRRKREEAGGGAGGKMMERLDVGDVRGVRTADFLGGKAVPPGLAAAAAAATPKTAVGKLADGRLRRGASSMAGEKVKARKGGGGQSEGRAGEEMDDVFETASDESLG